MCISAIYAMQGKVQFKKYTFKLALALTAIEHISVYIPTRLTTRDKTL